MSVDQKPALRIVAPPAWSASLALLLADVPLRVIAEEGLPHVGAHWNHASGDLVVLHVSADSLVRVGDFMVGLPRHGPRIRTVVVGQLALQFEWRFREIGAVAVAGFAWEAPRIARIARRHFRDLPPKDKEENETLHRILQQLPWAPRDRRASSPTMKAGP